MLRIKLVALRFYNRFAKKSVALLITHSVFAVARANDLHHIFTIAVLERKLVPIPFHDVFARERISSTTFSRCTCSGAKGLHFIPFSNQGVMSGHQVILRCRDGVCYVLLHLHVTTRDQRLLLKGKCGGGVGCR